MLRHCHLALGGSVPSTQQPSANYRALADRTAALAIISLGFDDLDVALFGVFVDLVGLVVGRRLLALRRYAHILRCSKPGNLATPIQLSLRSAFQSVGRLRG